MIEDFYWFQAGYCTAIEAFSKKGGAFKSIRFPAVVGLWKHSTKGWILFDTGYHPNIFEATRKWPYRVFRYTTPAFLEKGESVAEQMTAAGINPSDIQHLLLSHLHADHMAGMGDFNNARYWMHSDAAKLAQQLSPKKALKQGMLSSLFPPHWADRSSYFSAQNAKVHPQFESSWDMFGDGSLEVVALPGHAAGQVGVIFRYNEKHFLLAADAAWHMAEITTLQMPPFPGSLIAHDRKAYQQTLINIQAWWKLNPDALVVPTHDLKIFEQVKRSLHVI